ncbi:hypothetical protein [Aquihabitans sp. McL0605]|uniref:hypothetical protein n=1 Tax=Aquihabitans sp. McL0605 TaxID=3415671 RepID=UPI003CF0C90C
MTDGAGSRVTVVVANADETVCEVLARVIEAGGHESVRVTDATQVSSAVNSASADAVLLDLGAANVDQLRNLRSEGHPRGSDARAVVISTGPANSLLAWQAGADAVLTRPFKAEELQATLADVLGRTNDARAAIRAAQVQALSA